MNRPATSSRPTWPVPVLIGLVAALAIALTVIAQQPSDSPAAPAAARTTDSAAPAEGTGAGVDAGAGAVDGVAPPTTVDRGETPDLDFIERRDPADPVSVGPLDAPVALVVFSDYQCPYCAKWSNETLPELQAYIDAGDLRIEWRDVNIFGEASERGARAVYAAGLQGEFEAMHNAMFADGLARSETELSDERLSALATDLGLDGDQFDADYQSESTHTEVARNQQLGLDIGAFTTPAFILGGTPIVGAQPTEIFITAMDEALAATQNVG